MQQEQKIQQKKNLYEISFMRPILIIILVMFHCFTVFNGGWDEFDGFREIPTYKWIARSLYSFMLESFIFISGYILAFQRISLKRKEGFVSLVKKKASRLICPSILFSILYLQFFYTNNLLNSTSISEVFNCVMRAISGVGHMWYLPVLFWCFVFMWIIEKSNVSDKILLPILIVASIVKWPSLPFQLGRVPYDFLYFYFGYKMWQYGVNYRNKINFTRVACLWILFLFVFIIFRNLKDTSLGLNIPFGLLTSANYTLSRTCQLLYAGVGTLAFYSTAVLVTRNYSLPSWVINTGTLCFGVYIYQEFIIKYVYYYTNLPTMFDCYYLPWVVFVITLILSLAISKITKVL